MSAKKLGFAENFALSGAAAVISKTAAAPIERVKLLVQNQEEMIKQGILDRPYKGVIDCTARTFKPIVLGEGAGLFASILAWKSCQLHPILPHTGLELCLQGSDQGSL